MAGKEIIWSKQAKTEFQHYLQFYFDIQYIKIDKDTIKTTFFKVLKQVIN